MKHSVSIIVASFLCAFCGIANSEPSMQIFSKQPPNDTISIILKASRPIVPDIEEEIFAANYVCNYGGVWLAYITQNYTSKAWLLADPGCQHVLFSPINSAWLLESSKDTTPTLHVFQNVWWSEPEHLMTSYTQDYTHFFVNFNSIIVTNSDAITLYSEVSYEGRSVCLRPEPESTTIYQGDIADVGFKFDEIKSFRFGCYSSNIVHTNNMQRNQRLGVPSGI